MFTVKFSRNPELSAHIENQKATISSNTTLLVPMIMLPFYWHCFNQSKATSPAAEGVKYICNLAFLNLILG